MRTFPDVRMRRLHDLSARGGRAREAGAHGDAVQLYRELARELEKLGLQSGWVHWSLAVSHDHLEEFDMALSAIRKSLELDPLSPMAHHSFEIIVRRVREHLHALPVEHESIPKLYGLLQQSGDVDVPTHLLMARHFSATARLDRAQELLDCLTLMAPASREVWAERARLARQQGDLAAAANFEAEAHARCRPEVPFSIPTRHED